MDRMIRKRDGQTVQPFDVTKVTRAVSRAWRSVFPEVDAAKVDEVVARVVDVLPEGTLDVESVQDVVESVLMKAGHTKVAKHYILYRNERAEARALRDKKPDPRALSDYIHASKYARHRPELGRREVYPETVGRVEDMHLGRFPHMAGEIKWAFDLVREQKVLPSMRAMQFAGPAIEASHCRQYNCSYTLIDRLEAFSEGMYLLLCGCGVGYSVQFDHVEKLPALTSIDPKRIKHHVVADNIEGWADALKVLVASYTTGEYVEFSYHQVRPAGAPLKTSGGRAPGHIKLKSSLERVREVLDGAQGRKLKPIECHRIMCHAADAVLSGGIRRSAMIALFSLDDGEMMSAKTGKWFKKDPWFANANNSVVLKRDDVKRKQFMRIFQMTREWGEPGFFFTSNYDYGANPCVEIALNPVLVIDEEIKSKLAKRDIQVQVGDRYTGFAFCNLCEINAAKFTSLEDFLVAARAAALIGTLQAAYTEMPYLGWVSEMLAEREALLGVSMTGMLDAPRIACDPSYQRMAASEVRSWNAKYAEMIGVKPAARTTCVKPAGTSSLELGCVGSGHHAHHARRYIRRVTANDEEFVFQEFRKHNPGMCVRKPNGDWVIEFPVQAPDGAIVKADLTAIQFLEMVKSTQRNWVIPGTGNDKYTPGATHNVSNTVHVKPEEWDEVAEYLWNNREFFAAVSLIQNTSDKDYAFAPNEEIKTEADEARWNNLITHYKPVDYSTLVEVEDTTALAAEPACAGGACEVQV
jgi:ribonucleoside-triphosphate reductase